MNDGSRGAGRADEIDLDVFGSERAGVKQHARAASEVAQHDDGGSHGRLARRL